MPVNVVTGVLFDTSIDAWLEGSLPFSWQRHYDSQKHNHNRGLGWGHTHAFDRSLRFTFDHGIRYRSFDGSEVVFPQLDTDGDHAAALGHRLERVTPHWYRVHLPGGAAILEFEVWHPVYPARLNAITQGQGQGQTLLYYNDETGLLASFVTASNHTIRVDWLNIPDAHGRQWPHIAALVLLAHREPAQVHDFATTFALDDERTRPWEPSQATDFATTFALDDERTRPWRPTDLPAPRGDRPLVSYQYDARACLVGGTDVYQNPFSFEYDAKGRMVRRVDQRGYAFLFEHDSRDRCVRTLGEDGVEDVRLEYLEGVTIATNADEGQWIYEHADGFLHRVIDPYGAERRRELGDDGQIAQETDEAGRVFRVVRDDSTGEVLGRQDSVGRLWPLNEAPKPPPHYVPTVAREWEFGAILTAGYGFPVRRYLEMEWVPPFVIDALATPPSNSNHLDHFDNTVDRWNENTVRDAHGLTLRVERAGVTARRTWHYDHNGYWIRYTDFDGATWRREHASWNHLRELVDPLGARTTFEHTAREQIVRITDAEGVIHGYAYDLRNRLAEVSRHGAVRETYQHGVDDELAEKVDAHGRWLVRYARSDEGRHVVRTLASGERHEMRYTYARQLQTAVIEGPGGARDEYAFEYTSGRRTRDERNGQGVRRQFADGSLSELRVLEHFVTRYRYSTWGTVKAIEIVDPTGVKQTIHVHHGGVVRKKFSNGTEEFARYHPHGHCLLKMAIRKSGEKWERTFVSSEEGDVQWIADSARTYVRSFRYDAAHRLVGERLHTGAEQAFAHSPAGDLLESPTLRNVATDGHRLVQANGHRFAYDHRHHLATVHTGDGTLHLRRDARDQLVLVHGPGVGSWSARYDMLSRRIETVHNGETTTFYWDSDRLAAEISPDGRVRVYVYPDALALVPLMFVDYESASADPASGKRHFILANHLGAPEVVEDDAGADVWRAWYEAYGLIHVEVGADVHQPIRWPGHYSDAATGLHYNRFRYFSPALGRYVESDPDGIRGGINLHAYALGNPLRFVDVRGLGCGDGTGKPNDKEDKPDEEAPKTLRMPHVSGIGNVAISFKAPEPPKYRTHPLLEKYKGEGHPPGIPMWGGKIIHYCDATERQKYLLTVKDGKLYDSTGKLFDTTQGNSVWSNDPRAIFVMDDQGNIYASNYHKARVFHHSSFLDGGEVASAGELKAKDGVLQTISNESGHYHPPSALNEQAVQELQSRGVDMTNVTKAWKPGT